MSNDQVVVEGIWNMTFKGPTGTETSVLALTRDGHTYSGTQTGKGSTSAINDFKVDGNQVSWINHVTFPLKLKVEFKAEIIGTTMSGKSKAGIMGTFPFTGVRS